VFLLTSSSSFSSRILAAVPFLSVRRCNGDVVVVFPGIIIARFFIEEEEEEDKEEVKALEAEKAEDVVLVCVQKE
jgi:hypothetical protein